MNTHLSYEIDNRHPQEKKRFIREMFDSIVPTYDFLNHMLSMGIDFFWRRNILGHLGDIRGKKVLDLCCGTGDLSHLLAKKGAGTISLDFSMNMLKRGLDKKYLGSPVAADAGFIPFREESFAAATIAFGIRNIPDIDTFIQEAFRVLIPGGRLVILELIRPRKKLIRTIYAYCLSTILPLVGGVVSGRPAAYRYLSATIVTFVSPNHLQSLLEKHGFGEVEHHPQTPGVATIIICRKARL